MPHVADGAHSELSLDLQRMLDASDLSRCLRAPPLPEERVLSLADVPLTATPRNATPKIYIKTGNRNARIPKSTEKREIATPERRQSTEKPKIATPERRNLTRKGNELRCRSVENMKVAWAEPDTLKTKIAIGK